MASLFRPISVKPIPPGAEPCEVGGKPGVRWRNRKGSWTTAQLTEDGKRVRVRSPNYWIEYYDAQGVRQREKVGKLRAAAENRLGEIVRDVERARGNLAPLAEAATNQSFGSLAEEYRAYLQAQGRSTKHVAQSLTQILAVSTEASWRRVQDVKLADWSRWVTAQRTAGLSAETVNHYLRALRGFLRWLCRTNRIALDPLSAAEPLNADADRRVHRRTLTAEEFRKLIDATRASTKYRLGLSGESRAALYLLAGTTGLRAGELASLRPADVHHAASPPFVAVSAKRAKSRRAADVPIPKATADELKGWLESRASHDLLWPGNWHRHQWSADMLRRDLEDAGIPPVTVEGQYDFHSLRSQYGTDLARAGVTIQVAQQLLRHSTPTLTARYYTRLNLADLAAGADRLGSELGRNSPQDPSILASRKGKKRRKKGAKKPRKNENDGNSSG